MSTGIKFNSFDDRYVTTTDQPTIIAVQSTSTSKKLCIIISGLVVIGIIATVGVILGVVILKKGLWELVIFHSLEMNSNLNIGNILFNKR